MVAYRWSLLSMVIATALAADPSVTWIKAPPEQVSLGQSFEVSWKVDGLDGSYHSVCFFCPEDAGKVCRKGPDRHDSEMFNSQASKNEYSYTFTFDDSIPEGRYYATAIGAYSRSDYHPSPSILVSYSHQPVSAQSHTDAGAPASSSTSSETQSGNESNSTSTTNNTTTVVRPAVVAPAIYWGEEEGSSTVTVNGTGAAASASEENQAQRQDAAEANQSQRQDAYNQNQQQQQRQNHAEKSSDRAGNARGEGRFGGEHSSGRGGFGGGHGGRR